MLAQFVSKGFALAIYFSTAALNEQLYFVFFKWPIAFFTKMKTSERGVHRKPLSTICLLFGVHHSFFILIFFLV